MSQTIADWCKEIGDWRRIQEFICPESIAEVDLTLAKLMLITTEVAEAAESVRLGDALNFEVELADIVIRVMDLCDAMSIDLETMIDEKMQFNRTRPVRHGKTA